MEPVIIPIYFDYASTLCYIAWRIVSELESELGFESLWKGVPISIRDFKALGDRELGPREYQKVIMVGRGNRHPRHAAEVLDQFR